MLVDWWGCYGGLATDLWQFGIRIIGLCCTSSGCERNWSTFEFVSQLTLFYCVVHLYKSAHYMKQISLFSSDSYKKKRNRLEHQRLNDLVYVQYNRKIDTRFKKRIAEGSDFINWFLKTYNGIMNGLM